MLKPSLTVPTDTEGLAKILVVYDGSPDSKKALKYGLQKVQAPGCELIALHVFSSFNSLRRDEESMAKESVRAALRRRKTVKTVVNAGGNPVTISVAMATGSNWHEVLKLAPRLAIDMIVAPSEFESLMDKACCLADIVSASTVFAEGARE
jgi:hypothetical protein